MFLIRSISTACGIFKQSKKKNLFLLLLFSFCLLPTFSFAQFNQLWNQGVNPYSGLDKPFAVTADASGVFIGGADNGGAGPTREWRIEKRSLSDGTLISGFGTSGVVQEDLSGCQDFIYGMTVAASGLFLAGNDCANWRIEKRNLTDGSFITAFNTTGYITGSSGGAALCIAADASAIYVAGYDNAPGNDEWRIEKLNSTTGAYDGGFGTSGVVTTNPSSFEDRIYAMAIDATGLYIVGSDENLSTDKRWRIEKRNLSDGSLIYSVTSDPSPRNDIPFGVAVDAGGVYIVGYDDSLSNPPTTIIWRWRIEKRSLTDGSYISGFGTGGKAVTSFAGSWRDQANAVAVNPNGLYITGKRYASPNEYDWYIQKRNLTSGSLDCSLTVGFTANQSDDALAIASDNDGIYVVGFEYGAGTNPADEGWRILKYDGCGLPVPVEFLYFTVKWKDENQNAALLEWATASETNNDYFEIQRSVDAVNFAAILQVPGAGNSSSTITYSQIDSDPIINETSYYRLKQVDFNGNFSYSNIAVLNAPEGIDIINIWPNPSVNNFTFMITSTNTERISIEVININGKKVISLMQTIAEGVSIISADTRNLVSGFYLLRVITESGNYKDQMQLIINRND